MYNQQLNNYNMVHQDCICYILLKKASASSLSSLVRLSEDRPAFTTPRGFVSRNE